MSVYIEELTLGPPSIEGVPTSVVGFAGMTRWGPVPTAGGPGDTAPRLVASFPDFERVYGGLEPLQLEGGERPGYLAHAARAFFQNGGQRLYVSRVFTARAIGDGIARLTLPVANGEASATWHARWPGRFGNVQLKVSVSRSRNIAFVKNVGGADVVQAKRAAAGSVVEIVPPGPPLRRRKLDPASLYGVAVGSDGRQTFHDQAGQPWAPPPGHLVRRIELKLTVATASPRSDEVHAGLGLHPDHDRWIGRVLAKDEPADEHALVWLGWDPDALGTDEGQRLGAAVQLAVALARTARVHRGRLRGGNDGVLIGPAALRGTTDEEFAAEGDTGLAALAAVADVALVAAPDASTLGTEGDVILATQHVLTHAQEQRYRMALVDAPPASSTDDVRRFRTHFDSRHAALYHPWLVVTDPLDTESVRELLLPPSGFVAGCYARNDIERGVHEAPANVAVHGVARLEAEVNKSAQDVLNPEGINALRFFDGQGIRIWGARTLSTEPEWKYVNLGRLLMYLERSIERSTQWVVFEPNDEPLWTAIRASIENFLLVQWRAGALQGSKPDEAFFVRCDRTTMTQDDIDSGRLIALVGVAPLRPAEFVIFRIGQWTAAASS